MAQGDIKLSSNFELNSQRALDARVNVDSIALRDALPEIQRYDRMIVSIKGGGTFQLMLGQIDQDLNNNLNWAIFGDSPKLHDRNFDSQIIYNTIPTLDYVFGVTGQTIIKVKEFTVNFVGIGKYINEIAIFPYEIPDLLDVYDNDVLIYTQNLTLVQIVNSSGFIVDIPFVAILGKNYKLRFRKSAGLAFWQYWMTTSTYSEEGVTYQPTPFTVDYTKEDNSIVTGYSKCPIIYIKGIKSSKVEAIEDKVIVTASELDVKANARIEGDLIVEKNIIQNGATYETHAEQLYTAKDLIILRENAIAALASLERSGFKIIKYDGVNNLLLAVDRDGIARIGDESGTLQALATREDAPVDGGFAKWNASTLRFETIDLNLLFAALNHTHNYLANTKAAIEALLTGAITSHTHQSGTFPDFENDAADIKMNGVAAGGSLITVSRGDHIHPTDTSREAAFAKNSAWNANFETSPTEIKMNGLVSVGVSNNIARADHVHAKDTTKADLADPAFNGTVNLGAGTATKAPLKFTKSALKSSNNLSGDIQFDGTDYWGTPDSLMPRKLAFKDDIGTGWITSHVPIITTTTGAITTKSAICSYMVIGKICHINIMINITTNGTGASSIIATLPFTSENLVGSTWILNGAERYNVGFACYGINYPNTNSLTINKYDGGYPGANGNIIYLSGLYRIQ